MSLMTGGGSWILNTGREGNIVIMLKKCINGCSDATLQSNDMGYEV